MKISNITITNLKSFRDKISIDFDPTFNIIGPNASGKSNL
ncbi:AAA ATPase domain-containing protein [Pedobacter terrae]|uniref:AAA ATPase domain-containing protein n=1 Tax=Pedobacter terrae TaxID=405671 RepID=A0A1G7XGS6_9SPHI|nr:AAA family ATPase [Pedobacter terrae]SDG82790.1 AAA ATPase domain-containing protein [Pedobacter terrae]